MLCNGVLLKIENICFAYGSKNTLEGVTIEADEGEFIGLMGPNGSGKTTLMRCINRVLSAQEGTVFIEGVDTNAMKMIDIAKKCASIPANAPDECSLSVRQYVSLGRFPYMTNIWWEGEDDQKIVDQALNEFNVTQFSSRKLSELSSGEKARVLLAKGVVQNPKVMLVDEPSAHLDLRYQLQVMESLKALSRTGMVVITASHDINLLTKYCDKIILLERGRIASYGSPSEVVTEDGIKRVYGIQVSIIKCNGNVFILPLRAFEEEELVLA